MSPKRPWTPAHDDYVRSHPGMTATEIGEVIGHHSNTVHRHAVKLKVTLKKGVPVSYTRTPKPAQKAPTRLDFSAMNLWGGTS